MEITKIKFTEEKLSKIGNTLIYLVNNIEYLTISKLLAILFLIETESLKKYKISFFEIESYFCTFDLLLTVIHKDLFLNLETFKNFVFLNKDLYIKSNNEFDSHEFSENDLKLLDTVLVKFNKKY